MYFDIFYENPLFVIFFRSRVGSHNDDVSIASHFSTDKSYILGNALTTILPVVAIIFWGATVPGYIFK